MSDTYVLSKVEEDFLKKYLKNPVFKRKANKQTRKAYVDFLTIAPRVKIAIDALPAEDRAGPQGLYTRADDIQKQGEFAAALAKLTEAEQGAARIKAAIETRKGDLLGKINGVLVPTWDTLGPRSPIELARGRGRLALAAPLPTKADLTLAEAALADMLRAKATGDVCAARRAQLIKELALLTDPPGIGEAERKAMKQQRDLAVPALGATLPTDPNLAIAEKAIDTLRTLVEKAKGLAALTAKDPARGQLAAAAFTDYGKALKKAGITAVTPEVVARTAADATAAGNAYKTKKSTQNTVFRAHKRAAATQATALLNRDQAQAAVSPEALKGLSGEEVQRRQSVLAAATQALAEANDAEKAAKQVLDRARKESAAAKRDLDAKMALETAAFGENALTKAIAHGPLSAETANPLDPVTAQQFLKVFKSDPKLAALALGHAATAQFPKEIGKRIEWAAAQVATGFKSPARDEAMTDTGGRVYAGALLKAAGDAGPGFDRYLDDYIASGQQFEDDPLSEKDVTNYRALAEKRCLAVGSSLVKSDGAIAIASDGALGSSAAKNAVGNALYHPDSVRDPVPSATKSMLKTLTFLSDDANRTGAENVLKACGAPKNDAAKGLVRRALGKPDDDSYSPTTTDTRVAVMSAMLSPIHQGSVGSCFATGPVMRQREMQPIDSMKGLSQIANDGEYKPLNGPKVPAVTNLPANDNPLTRSLEYSFATAMGQKTDSQQKATAIASADKGLDKFAAAAGGNWKKKRPLLKQALSDDIEMVYDPEITTELAADGSSSKGRWVMVRNSNKERLDSPAKFAAAMADIAATAFAANDATKQKLNAAASDPSFAAAWRGDKYKPWEQQGGGWGPDCYKTMYGDDAAKEDVLPNNSDSAPEPAPQRTAKLLAGLVKGFKGSGDAMTALGTPTHFFNGLPQSDMMQSLMTGDDPAANVKPKLIDPGAAVARTDLSAERAAWMFDDQIARALAAEKDDALTALITGNTRRYRPVAPMKPGALTDQIAQALTPYHEALADKKATEWAANEERAGKPRPAADKIAEKQRAIRDQEKTNAEIAAKNLVIRDTGVPQVEIADTNWGGPLDKTLFVVAPDPTTGELTMWRKTIPPGTLSPADRKWVDGYWDMMK